MTLEPRPASLAITAARSDSFKRLGYEFQDFLHEFASDPAAHRLAEAPPLMRDRFPQGDVGDAYLAATAVYLSHQIGASLPQWTFAPERYLHEPWFATPGSSMRACLLLESPAAFRSRNLFVTANALSVA